MPKKKNKTDRLSTTDLWMRDTAQEVLGAMLTQGLAPGSTTTLMVTTYSGLIFATHDGPKVTGAIFIPTERIPHVTTALQRMIHMMFSPEVRAQFPTGRVRFPGEDEPPTPPPEDNPSLVPV
ncbi:MAG: hypothetical protein WC822_01340 [Candidatus Paceibacterota bacterium]|jgi:hypothetical protein